MGNGWREVSDKWEENWNQIRETDRKAREAGKLIGRYIQHPYADGYAIYQITRENKKSVRINVCTGLGDDWVLPAWGTECTIQKTTALNFLDRQTALEELFS